jgi:hypothetical protein
VRPAAKTGGESSYASRSFGWKAELPRINAGAPTISLFQHRFQTSCELIEVMPCRSPVEARWEPATSEGGATRQRRGKVTWTH